ncbi:oocyte zinc finger protein XlCOF26-like [Phlebotomus argentipes]|uniref:oocyte zinc finger protein XlCOF26-like n=1 Tax=Phlebotomus argentipes TaxID=94469 RepID=UPI002892ED36|nr:oocyte zinc finger protein XlCOF26-like [Phlebotomus argentipes]
MGSPQLTETSDTEAEQIPRKSRINYTCPWEGCKRGFRRENEFDRHFFSHTGIKKYTCEVEGCTKSYIITDHLRRHVKASHETIGPEEISCSVPDCTMIFTTRSNMMRHFRKKHENPRVFSCLDCQEVFRRKDQLRRHRMQHTGQFPHVCDVCGKGFLNLKAFKSHGVVHRQLKCPQCEVKVNNWTELVTHRRREHQKVFKCASCDKEFHTKGRLRSHEVTHLPREQQPSFICDLCDREYSRKSNLAAHIHTVHENKKFSCNVCQATLSTNRRLKEHITKIHSKEPKKPRQAPQRPRNRRKDAGKSRISMASMLAGVSAPPEVEKMLLKNEGNCLELDYSPVLLSGSATDTESEMGFPLSGMRVTVKGHI